MRMRHVTVKARTLQNIFDGGLEKVKVLGTLYLNSYDFSCARLDFRGVPV